MTGYPWIYWLVVVIVAGAVCTVLMGIGYLLGRRSAIREATAELHALNLSLKRSPIAQFMTAPNGQTKWGA